MVTRKDEMDDWGVDIAPTKNSKVTSVSMKKKLVLGLLSVAIMGSLGFWVNKGSKKNKNRIKIIIT